MSCLHDLKVKPPTSYQSPAKVPPIVCVPVFIFLLFPHQKKGDCLLSITLLLTSPSVLACSAAAFLCFCCSFSSISPTFSYQRTRKVHIPARLFTHFSANRWCKLCVAWKEKANQSSGAGSWCLGRLMRGYLSQQRRMRTRWIWKWQNEA